MTTFTSSLPDNLLQRLEEKARQLSVPKNKLIERALSIYLDQLNRAEYVRSYRQMADDTDMLNLAEEGMGEYLKQLPDEPLP
ncbi:MAG: ribbon-helix-helix domain-containing protein [Bacteroidetes bacterium]|nr:MAG: ribbon-helix-helix domain-containing protein [Bacteroidota bacterium]